MEALLDQPLRLAFRDIDPGHYQDKWQEPLPDGKSIEQVIMRREHGQQLWRYVRKKGREPPSLIVVADARGDAAVSIAYALADTYEGGRKIVWVEGYEEGVGPTDPPNKHIFEMTTRMRESVL
jgi:hypothetical protein